MKKVILFGLGSVYHKVKDNIDFSKAQIVSVCDSKSENGGKFDGYDLISLNEILKIEYDFVIISSSFYNEIEEVLKTLGVSEEKLISYCNYERKFYEFFLGDIKYNRYLSLINEDYPVKNFKILNSGSNPEDSVEFFSYYEASCFWMADKINNMGNNKKILDLGNKKLANAILSLNNNITSIVLKDCDDQISKVKYLIQDVKDKLPFENGQFDVFSSLVSIHLLGFGRYGDEVNPYTLINFIQEINRVMKNKGDLIISTMYGKKSLLFDCGWIFDIDTIKLLFEGWELIDYLIDNHAGGYIKEYEKRYTKDLNIDKYENGEYKIIFLHFRRGYTD
ncbi:DUF268 domain-containing protein [Clostridium sp. P21]|uniref:DUF268 domain-containing protein n=1 Tax=Clostridium muellerianum TaxID=2716538 RepID=A0A7Y0HLS3_9CLOT|nr:DUF268 domain-containing protein [Clostridium muellerianum]NMM61485.1 DUF268 domain-containing protein [Clostridium muellerianum]